MILNAEAIAHLQVILDGAKPSGSKQSELITKLGAIMSECYKLKEYGIDIPDSKFEGWLGEINTAIDELIAESGDIPKFGDIPGSIATLKGLTE